MYYVPNVYPYPCFCCCNMPMHNFREQPFYRSVQPNAISGQERPYFQPISKDFGKDPFAINLDWAAKQNNAYRTVIWTGDYFQVTLMSINVGDDIGLEVHPKANQFTYIVDGQGFIEMGNSKDNLYFTKQGGNGFSMIVPAGTWHNITNTGNTPLKLYTIYAPPLHPFGAVEMTKEEAEATEGS